MQQIFVKNKLRETECFTPQADQAHHLSVVVRMKPGEQLRIVDGSGCSFLAEVEGLEPFQLRVLSRVAEEREMPVPVTLLAGLIKGERWDWLLQKCTELGVSRIVPFQSSRTVVKITEEKAVAKRQRWRKIVQEAAQQCKRTQIPEVEAPLELLSAARIWQARQNFVAYENASIHGGQLHHQLVPDQPAVIVIGPEGGFSEAEMDQLQALGYRCCSLGPRILRAETAAVYAVCACNFVFQKEDSE